MANKLKPIKCRIESRHTLGAYGGWGFHLAIDDHHDRESNKNLEGIFLGFSLMDHAENNFNIINSQRLESLGERPLVLTREIF